MGTTDRNNLNHFKHFYHQKIRKYIFLLIIIQLSIFILIICFIT